MPYKNIKKLKKIFLKKIASRKTVENRFLKFKIFCTIVLTILLLSANLYAASDNSNGEGKEAVDLGVENYVNLKKDKDEKSIKNFEHKFFIDGQIKNFKIKNDEKVSVQVDTGKILLSNGQEYKLQNKVLIKNDRILLSLTNISKLFKMTNGNINDGIRQDIEWDGSLRTVSVKIK